MLKVSQRKGTHYTGFVSEKMGETQLYTNTSYLLIIKKNIGSMNLKSWNCFDMSRGYCFNVNSRGSLDQRL